MALLPAHPETAFDYGASSQSNRFPGAATPDAIPEPVAAPSTFRAASEISLHDSVELSGQSLSTTAASQGILQSQTSYQLDATLELRVYESLLSANTQTTQPDTSIDFSALRNTIGKNFGAHFGSNSDLVAQWDSVSSSLEELHPRLGQALMILMKMLSQDDPDAAAAMLDSMESVATMLQSSGGSGSDSNGVLQGHYNVSVRMESVQVQLSTALESAGGTRSESGSVSLEIGEFSLRIESGHVTLETRQVQQGDPLILDLDGDGINLTSAENGVQFDLTGNGTAEQTAFIQGDDALLYLDQNGNGTADDGRELFGDQEGDAHGFAELARYDENSDGQIDAADSVYDTLRLWQDVNGDGINQLQESMSLAQAGIESLRVSYEESSQDDAHGNTLAQRGSFLRTDGREGKMVDALLRYYR